MMTPLSHGAWTHHPHRPEQQAFATLAAGDETLVIEEAAVSGRMRKGAQCVVVGPTVTVFRSRFTPAADPPEVIAGSWRTSSSMSTGSSIDG